MKTRIFWIDIVKVLAILMVILAHVLWIYEQDGMLGEGMSSQFLTINRIIASLGVPLFMLVSGSLLLGKQFASKSDVLSFYRRGLLPLFLTAEIWIVVYCLLTLQPFSVKELLLCMAFCHKPEVHLWYVRLIVVYYLALPLLTLLRYRWKTVFILLLAVIFSFTFLYNGWMIYRGVACPTSSNRSYFCYMVYMAVGYGLSHVRLSRVMMLSFLLLAIMGGYVLHLSLTETHYFLWYDNPMLAIMAMSLFYLIRYSFSSISERECMIEVSKMSYGVYLTHFVFIYVIGRAMKAYVCNPFVFYGALLAVFVADALLLSFVKRCLPKVSKVLFRY